MADLAMIRSLARGSWTTSTTGAGAAASSAVAGRTKVKVLPWPTSDSTQIWPPAVSTTCLTITSPSPVPRRLDALAFSARKNSVKRRSRARRRDADAGIPHLADHLLAVGAQADRDRPALRRVFDRVADQVRPEALELVRHAADGRHAGRDLHVQPLALLAGLVLERLQRLAEHVVQADRRDLAAILEFAQSAQLQQVADERHLFPGPRRGLFDVFPILFRRHVAVEDELKIALDSRRGRL